MENVFSIEGLWAYIQSLSLSESNRNWLISKLQEPAKSTQKQEFVDELPKLTTEQIVEKVLESKKQYESGQFVTAEEFKKELNDYLEAI